MSLLLVLKRTGNGFKIEKNKQCSKKADIRLSRTKD